MTLSTRIGVMNDGKIIQVGEPPQIYEDPASKYVADFIGSVNMFEGIVDAAVPDALRVKSLEAGIDLLVEPVEGLKLGQSISIAVRPERIALTREKPENANVVDGEVEEVAYLGNISTYRVKLENGKTVKVTKSNLLHDEEPIKWDEKVYLSWSKAAGIVLAE